MDFGLRFVRWWWFILRRRILVPQKFLLTASTIDMLVVRRMNGAGNATLHLLGFRMTPTTGSGHRDLGRWGIWD